MLPCQSLLLLCLKASNFSAQNSGATLLMSEPHHRRSGQAGDSSCPRHGGGLDGRSCMAALVKPPQRRASLQAMPVALQVWPASGTMTDCLKHPSRIITQTSRTVIGRALSVVRCELAEVTLLVLAVRPPRLRPPIR